MRGRLMASSMISGAALAALSASGAYAQSPAAQAAPAADNATSVTEFVVTGSRIPQPNLTSTSPITVVGAEEAKLEGSVRVEDLLNNLPQVFGGQGGGVSNGTTGTADVDLRDLGPTRTLVLIDGRRVMPGDPFNPVTDLNFIPEQLIDRVEVLTGGASAVYGSDAVAGVVNFITLKNFEGIRLDAQIGGFQHDNGNRFIQGLNADQGYTAPTGSTWDGRQTNLSALLGVSSPDGKGNIEAYFTYRNIQPINQGQRDYSNCALQEAGNSFVCKGSPVTALGHLFSNDLAAQSQCYNFFVDAAGPGNTLRQASPQDGAGCKGTALPTDVFNFNPFNYFQRPDEQYSAGAYAHYEVNPHFDAYMQLMFMDDHTVGALAPSGIFGQTFNIGCSSPLLSAQEVTTLCTDAGLGPNDQASVAILRRNVEGGPRLTDLRHTDYRVVLGVKGEINSDWSYDAYAQIGRAVFQNEVENDLSLLRIGNALNAKLDDAGNLVCAGDDPLCVPYLGAFSAATPSAASLNYISAKGFENGSTTEMVASASVTGKIPQLRSPWAEDPVGVAFGGEYRQEQLDLRVDNEFDSGDLAGFGVTHGVNGSFNVYEGYGELRAPLIQNAPFVKSLSFEGGYRYSHYSRAGETNTYKVAGDWQPTEDIRFRVSYNRAVRAPNILELFTPQSVLLGVTNDPCAGPATQPGFPTEAQCANSGVTAAEYGHIAKNPANQYNALFGGNLDLKPETAKTLTVGAVLTPRMIPGLSVSVDYFHINVDQFIQPLDPTIVLGQCIASGDPTLCALIHRTPGNGSLFLGTQGFVTATSVNVGFLKTSGIDFSANYRLPLSNLGWENGGSLSFVYNGTYLNELITNPGVPATDQNTGKVFTQYDCAGLYGLVTCANPAPRYRHHFRVSWRTPVEGLEISGAWRYFGPVDSQTTSNNPFLSDPANTFPIDRHLNAQNYFDLSGQWRLKEKVTFRAGVNNIFDKEPPLVGSNTGGATNSAFNGNTYPVVYDSLGRYLFVGATVDF